MAVVKLDYHCHYLCRGVQSAGELAADADGSRGPRKRPSAVRRRLALSTWPKRRLCDL